MTTKTAENKSRFYITKTINEAKGQIEKKIKTYNEKYIKKQFENSREFITELKTDPIKTIDDLIDDSQDVIKRVRSARMETLQKKVDTTKKDVRRQFKKVDQKTRIVYKGIESDAKLIAEDLITLGKKNLDKLPMKKIIEKKISAGIDSIPAKLNIPSKAEIDNLLKSINGVNQKVDALNKKQFADA